MVFLIHTHLLTHPIEVPPVGKCFSTFFFSFLICRLMVQVYAPQATNRHFTRNESVSKIKVIILINVCAGNNGRERHQSSLILIAPYPWILCFSYRFCVSHRKSRRCFRLQRDCIIQLKVVVAITRCTISLQ